MMRDDIGRNFGIYVKQKRLQMGLSQENLAALSGLHRTYIGPIEKGKKNITLQTAAKLAEALGTSLSKIFLDIEEEIS